MIKNKILIIDADADFRDAVQSLLESNGYDAVAASNGHEGYQKAKDESPDLIILDMRMSRQEEFKDIASALGADAALQDIPVILISDAGHVVEEGRDCNCALPVKMIIERPVNSQQLLQAIRTYIAKTGEKHREMVSEVGTLVDKWRGKKGSLVMILHEIQNHYGYVPRNVAFVLSELMDIPMAQIYEVITFYNFFKLSAPGKNIISICMGTACYLKGAPSLIEEFKQQLGVNEGESTKDGLFHLQLVRCLGCCGLAPVVMINDKVYGKLSPQQVKGVLDTYRTEAKV